MGDWISQYHNMKMQKKEEIKEATTTKIKITKLDNYIRFFFALREYFKNLGCSASIFSMFEWPISYLLS